MVARGVPDIRCVWVLRRLDSFALIGWCVMVLRWGLPRRWRGMVADGVLMGLVVGPLAAPLLQAWGWFGPRAVAMVIYTMGGFVCPQPAQGVALVDGFLMAVCMRCYGTVLGLLVTRVVYGVDGGRSGVWLARYGGWALLVFGLLIFVYAAEFAGEVAGLWGFDQGVVTLAGVVTGCGLGLMFHPLLQAGDGAEVGCVVPQSGVVRGC